MMYYRPIALLFSAEYVGTVRVQSSFISGKRYMLIHCLFVLTILKPLQ
jgi:hypothetical protein